MNWPRVAPLDDLESLGLSGGRVKAVVRSSEIVGWMKRVAWLAVPLTAMMLVLQALSKLFGL
jgi:hypothetical protein